MLKHAAATLVIATVAQDCVRRRIRSRDCSSDASFSSAGGEPRQERRTYYWGTRRRSKPREPGRGGRRAGEEAAGAQIDRETTSFIISLVPPKIRVTRASRHSRAIRYSFM